jgi:hypothetical protein
MTFTCGDVMTTIKPVADPGWIVMDGGTIGDAVSGATTRAHADTSSLFILLWERFSDANCPVSGGRGFSAAHDFLAHKTIALAKAASEARLVLGATVIVKL